MSLFSYAFTRHAQDTGKNGTRHIYNTTHDNYKRAIYKGQEVVRSHLTHRVHSSFSDLYICKPLWKAPIRSLVKRVPPRGLKVADMVNLRQIKRGGKRRKKEMVSDGFP